MDRGRARVHLLQPGQRHTVAGSNLGSQAQTHNHFFNFSFLLKTYLWFNPFLTTGQGHKELLGKPAKLLSDLGSVLK